MSMPCAGELQFWDVMRSQMCALVKQVTRIADALEYRNFRDGLPVEQHIADELAPKAEKETPK